MKKRIRFVSLTAGVAALIFAVLACQVQFSSGTNATNQTQTALATQQTALAQQIADSNATATAQQATLSAGFEAPAPPPGVEPPADLLATQNALAAQLTAAALQTQPPGEPPATQPPLPPADFEARMKQATVLVYEDIVDMPGEKLYVRDTLKTMGIQNVKWDGDAMGWLKSDMLAGAPNGEPWDLVILAIESRDEVSGEYFEYLSQLLNQGTSVILEAWHLDAVSEGAISPILAQCGVMVYPYIPKTGTVNDVVMWTLPGAQEHPLLTTPNAGLTFTRARDTWLFSFDLGSLMALTGRGDAVLLLGTKATEPYRDGTLAVCMGGQLILQTFSSHSFPYDVMYPLWVNYIHNALQVRFARSQ